MNREQILESYTRSGVLPTVTNHVRYSLMVCYAIFLGSYFVYNEKSDFKNIKSLLLLSGVIFLTLFLHILAVRSGLLAYYIICIIGIIYFILKKNYKLTLAILGICTFLILISFNFIETFQKKWGYTLYDIEQSAIKESANNYSISMRLVSNKVGIKVFRSNPVFGTGEADLQSEIYKVYQKEYPFIDKGKYLSPHNQFLTILAGTGLIGFFVFVGCFYYPLFSNDNYKYMPLWTIYLILTVSFFTEDTLQTQIGFVFGLFFIMLNLHWLKEQVVPEE